MKVLLVGIRNWGLLYDLRKTLIQEGLDVDLLDPLDGFLWQANDEKIVFGKACTSNNFFSKNLTLLRNFKAATKHFNVNPRNYDVCNVHFLDIRYFFFKNFLKTVSTKLIVSTYGTDFYKYNKYSFLQTPLYRAADIITFSNILLLHRFNAFYNNRFNNKTIICGFGLTKLPLIKKIIALDDTSSLKKSFGIPLGKIVISVGYHSNPITQHLKILNAFTSLPDVTKKNIFVIFPMTYGGSPEYIPLVEEFSKDQNLEFITIKGFRSDEEISSLRIVSDIMINLPKSDQLSATMCEYIYAKNFVITGKWLPYDAIDTLKVNYTRIESFEELPTVLESTIKNFISIKPTLSKNQELIWNFSSWETVLPQWINAYNR